jgi:Glycosyl hydrolases family 28
MRPPGQRAWAERSSNRDLGACVAVHNIVEYGAVGDGEQNDAAAIQAAIDACSASGGGTVLVPSGHTFRTGTLTMKSHVELHLERGSVLQASGDFADYGDYRTLVPTKALRNGGTARPDFSRGSILLTALHADDIAITGAGVIDGGGRFFATEDLSYILRMPEERPFTVFFLGCDNVAIRDVTIRDGALWTLRLSGCTDVLIHGVRIDNDLRLPNNDGVDIDNCRRVRISDCEIRAGDDAICLKASQETAEYGPCSDITITGCTLMSTSTALNLGAENRSVIRDVVISSCVVRDSNRGLGINLCEPGDIENVLFADILIHTRLFHDAWWGRSEPIIVRCEPWNPGEEIGRVRNIHFRNVVARGENSVLVWSGRPGQISNVSFEGVRVTVGKSSPWEGGRWDLRPNPDYLTEHETAGIHLENVEGAVLRDCEVRWEGTEAERPGYFGPALVAAGVTGLVLENFTGEAAHPGRRPPVLIGDLEGTRADAAVTPSRI